MANENPPDNVSKNIFSWLTFIVVSVALYFIFIYAPTVKDEGHVQRIMYFHVPSAWTAFFAFFIVFVTSILFLWKKEREWDIVAHSSAEVGVVFCSLILLTGPVWAKPIWGTWWQWDPRLTSSLILWLIYLAYLMIKSQAGTGSQGARYAAVLGIVGFLDIPIIHFSVLWWRTIHPKPKMLTMEKVGSGLEPSMIITLMVSLTAFTFLYFLFMGQRIKLEKMKDSVEELKKMKKFN